MPQWYMRNGNSQFVDDIFGHLAWLKIVGTLSAELMLSVNWILSLSSYQLQ